ncbi:MAG: beta strand repeat-containing protein [Blastocatellia bacterium]
MLRLRFKASVAFVVSLFLIFGFIVTTKAKMSDGIISALFAIKSKAPGQSSTQPKFPILRAGNSISAPVQGATTIAPTGDPGLGFDIEGNLEANSPNADTSDWVLGSVGKGAAVFVGGATQDASRTFRRTDAFNNVNDNVFKSGLKANDNPNSWGWGAQKPGASDDINNAMLHVSTDKSENLWLMLGADRLGTGADSYLDFELLQNTLTVNGNGTFVSGGQQGGRTVGDLLLTLKLAASGGKPLLFVQRWQADGAGFNWVDVTSASDTAPFIATNGAVTPAPFTAFGGPNYAANQFGEAALNLTPLLASLQKVSSCLLFRTVLVKSKSSQAANATVLDFLEPMQVNFGTAPAVAVNSETICSGGAATLVANVTGGKSPYTYVWSGPNNFAAKTPSVSASAPGTYTVMVQDANGCASLTALGTVTITSAATVDAGADLTTCAATPSVILNGVVGGGATGATWSGGKGTFIPNANSLNAIYTPTAAEIAAGSVVLKLTTTGPCAPISDSLNIIVGATASARAGADQIVCANNPAVKLAGAIGGATGGVWTTNGTGTFSPDATTLNATYTPSPADLTTKGLTLTLTTTGGSCGTGRDQMAITITAPATVNAGADLEACASNSAVALTGQIGGSAALATWSGGAGTFTPNANTLNATYTPTAAEIAAGSVTLMLTTNNPVGPCGAVSDQLVITFTAAARANAGLDQTLCAANPVISLAGTISGAAASAIWSGGAGVFTPNANSLNATYTPTQGELINGGVTLTLTTNDPAGACGTASDQVKISFLAAPTANAGADRTVCATSPSVGLTGSFASGATSAAWVGGTGSFLPNRNTLNATYTPSASEIAAGSVTLTLTTNDPAGPCGTASDQMVITFNPAATANAGADQSLCAGNPTAALAGSFGGSASSASWVGGTGTFAPNRNTLNATYTPTAGEISAGSVTLTLTTDNPVGICGAVSDQVKINFTSAPTTTITAPAAVCANSTGNSASVLSAGTGAGYNWTVTNGTITSGQGTSQIAWTAGGSGTVTLGVTVTAGGGCSATGSKQASITSSASAAAGTDQTACQTQQGTVGFNLIGSVSGGSPSWSVVGSTGSAAAAIVSASSANTAVNVSGAGTVTLRLTVTGTNGCGSASDDVVLTANALPTANAGVDQTVCQTGSSTTFNLSGTTTNGSPSWSVVGTTGSVSTNLVNQNSANASASVSGLGTVTLRLTANSNTGCGAASDEVVLAVSSSVSATITTAASVCANSTGNAASVPDAGQGAGYNWTINNGTITGGQNTRTVTWTAGGSGSTTLSVSVSAPGGCNASNTTNVALTEAPLANAGADKTACSSGSTTVVTVNGSASGGTSQWSVIGSTGSAAANIVSPASATTSVNVTGAGTVTLRLTVTSASCGTVSDDVLLSVNACTPPVGPGLAFLADSEVSDSKAGSVLIFNIYTSNATVPALQNTRINITNVNPGLDTAVHLFFIDGESCSVADSYLCLTRNQTSSFNTADFDPGTTGFVIAVAVNAITGCPTNFNYLIGDEYVKFASGHSANLTAEAIAAISSDAMLCDGNSPIATLNFDGIAYNRLPRTLAVDDIPSRADGNDTMLIVNRIGGNLGIGTSTLGSLFGIVYNDTENAASFNLTGNCQLRGSLSSNFPRTVPRLDQFIPAGKSGWMRLSGFGNDGNKGISGAVINFNPNAATSAVAYSGGRNMHKLTLDTSNSLVIPVFPPNCR